MTEQNERLIFAKRLNNLMTLWGKSQTDLMKDLDLPSATVSSWVNGLRLPRMDKLKMLANYFGVSVPTILGYDVENTESPTNDKINMNYGELAKLDALKDLALELNDAGQQEAVRQVELLTKIPEYRKEDKPE